MQINFTAVNALPADPNQNILLFLLPKYASSNFQLEAWQKLNPGPNNGQSTISFDLTTQVLAWAADAPNQTALNPILPGQVLGVTSNSVGALSIGPSPQDADRVTPLQAGVVNNTSAIQITTDWFVNGTEVVRIQDVNQGQIVTFEMEPTIYVMAASPTLQGRVGSFNFTVQEVSKLTSYTIPPGVTDITMTWTRTGGGMGGTDLFTFNPASFVLSS